MVSDRQLVRLGVCVGLSLIAAFLLVVPHASEKLWKPGLFAANLLNHQAVAAPSISVEWAGNIRPHPVRSTGDENASSQIARLYVGDGTRP